MMDDTLIILYGRTLVEHDERLAQVLERISNLGMTLNSDKCTFAQPSVQISQTHGQGIRPDLKAIVQFITLTDVSDVRCFLGMVNQLSKFSPNLAHITQPLQELLVQDREWGWGEP